MTFKSTHYDDAESDRYISHVDSHDDSYDGKFKKFWVTLKPHEKIAFGVASVATVAAGTFGLLEGMQAFGRWQTRDAKPTPVIQYDDPSIPGHDSVAPDASEPSVTATSALPGKEPLTIKIPKK